MKKIPTEQQCFEILKEYGTPDHVIAHCKGVCSVAVALGENLNRVGYHIDIPLLRASALLHDIARVHPEHEKVGAEYLESIGYGQVGAVTKLHTKYRKYNPLAEIAEIDLLCIGDRTVLEDKYVGVEPRMEYIKAKAIRLGREHYIGGIDQSKEILKKYIGQIEKAIGVSLDDLMRGNYE